MLEFLKKILLPVEETETNKIQPELSIDEKTKVHIATCALFMEVANADNEFSSNEKSHIVNSMKNIFKLDDEYIAELLQSTNKELNESLSLYEFTDIVNKNFKYEDKIEIIRDLWKLSYMDETLHRYEDYFIRKIGGNLNLHHSDIIGAKIDIKEELKIK